MPILLFQDIKLNLNYPRPLKSSHENGKRTVAGKVRLSSAGKCPLVTGSLCNFSAPGYRSSERFSSQETGEVATTLGTLYRLLATGKRSKSWYFVFWSEMAYFSNLTALGNSHENYGISILDKNIVRLVFFTIIKVFVACKTTANYWGKVNKAISEVWSFGLQTWKVAGIK